MRLLITSVLIFLMLAAPTFASSFLPSWEKSTLFTLYGGSEGQEAWLIVENDFLEEDPGDLLEGIGDIVGLTPSSAYAWYRTRGNIAGDLPKDAQDFYYGIIYNRDTTAGRLSPFIASEQVKWTTDIKINRGYFGIGTDWAVNENLTLRGALWNDLGDNHRITGNMRWNPHGSIEVNAMCWLMIDEDDVWGLWRIRASHPVDNDLDVVAVIEGSSRTPEIILIGFSYEW